MRLVFDPFFILFGLVWYSGMRKWYARFWFFESWRLWLFTGQSPSERLPASHGWTFCDLWTSLGPSQDLIPPLGAQWAIYQTNSTPCYLTGPLSDTSAEIVWSTVSRFDAICLIRAKVVWYWYEIPLLIIFSCHFYSSKFCIPVNIPHCAKVTVTSVSYTHLTLPTN